MYESIYIYAYVDRKDFGSNVSNYICMHSLSNLHVTEVTKLTKDYM